MTGTNTGEPERKTGWTNRVSRDIAKAAAISRRAVAKIVAALTSGEYMESVADPPGSRADIIGFTPQGKILWGRALGESRKLEKRWAAAVGLKDLRDLKRQLNDLLETCDNA